MPKTVKITDLRMPAMAPDQMTSAMRQSGTSWYRFTLGVRNKSDRPIHLISDIRHMRYDKGSRTLIVELSDRDEAASRALGMPMPPRYRELGAGEEATIALPLSSPITFIEAAADGSRQSSNVRLPQDVALIECVVAYGSHEPPPRNLAAWPAPGGDSRALATVSRTFRFTDGSKARRRG
jgi:hypothetical protein